MIHRIHMLVAVVACALFSTSCATTEHSAIKYRYSATIWQSLSAEQSLLTVDGSTKLAGGLLGHYLGEPVSITEALMPDSSVTIGSLSISSPTAKKCLPIKKWTKHSQTVYAICDPQASDRCAVVLIETDSKALTEPLLKRLMEAFVPNKPDSGDGK
jgi:hypothetical protein